MKPVKTLFQSLLLLLVMLLALSPAYAHADSGKTQTLDYVALGDSLAAGILNETDPPNYIIGDGYPVYIQEGIEDQSAYDVNLINNGVGGFTTDNVLQQISNETVRKDLTEADLVTIDAGANDLLQSVDIGEFDPDNPDDAIEAATKAIKNINSNMVEILDQINTLNPDAPIYVMGYYNAKPYLTDKQLVIETVIDIMNNTIEKAADDAGAFFVPTFDAFVGHYEEYMPNPNNIHPNAAGYQVIADLFLEEIIPALPSLPPDKNTGTITLGKETPVSAGQQVTIEGTNSVLTMPPDLPQGTQLTVKDVSQSDEVKGAEGLKPAGKAFEFEFSYPPGTSSLDDFTLTMGYEANNYAADQVDIYYYNGETAEWERERHSQRECRNDYHHTFPFFDLRCICPGGQYGRR